VLLILWTPPVKDCGELPHFYVLSNTYRIQIALDYLK
jgi:hypothetical protein